jgi:lipopolysaccharide heptosyltransferase II
VKILQILPELNVGGVETGTVELARNLVKLGIKAVVVSAGGGLVKELTEAGVIHYQLPVDKKSFFNILKMIPELVKIIQKEEIDIVHARSRVPAWIAYFACRRTARPLITTCHGYYSRHLFSYPMGWGKFVICPSQIIAKHMIEDFGVPQERIRLIPRSVDLERFRYRPPEKKKLEEFNVGMIARITPLKGHLDFIKAMAKVSRSIPRFKIWIVGDAPPSKGAYKEQVQVLVRRLGLWHCTEFLGNQRDVQAILANLDLMVLATTTHEAFGRVIIEAQAAGVPVVATRIGGVIDIIEDGKTGLLVPPSDPSGIAEAALRIFNDRQLARTLAENAYEKVKEKYTTDLLVKKTAQVYKEATGSFKVLLIKFSSLGDIILSTAAIKAIREKFPEPKYKITFLVGYSSKDVLLRSPYIDELLVCDLKDKDKGLRGLLKLGSLLRKKNFDIVIDLQNNRKSHILSWLTLSLKRYGYDNKKFGFLLNHRIKDDMPKLGPLTHQFRILKMLGIDLKDASLELWPSEEDRIYAEELLQSGWISPNQKIIGINISASSRWLSKNWPLNNLIKLCEELSLRDIRVVLTGLEKDALEADLIVASVKGVAPINACAKTNVNQLACLIKKCSLYISSDSAPLHIAASMGTPFVALFGPTDPLRHLAPAKNYIVIKKDLPCSPCYKSKCKNKICMDLITPEEVLEAVDKLLQ